MWMDGMMGRFELRRHATALVHWYWLYGKPLVVLSHSLSLSSTIFQRARWRKVYANALRLLRTFGFGRQITASIPNTFQIHQVWHGMTVVLGCGWTTPLKTVLLRMGESSQRSSAKIRTEPKRQFYSYFRLYYCFSGVQTPFSDFFSVGILVDEQTLGRRTGSGLCWSSELLLFIEKTEQFGMSCWMEYQLRSCINP